MGNFDCTELSGCYSGKMPIIPHCDELFLKYFDPWYTDNDRRRKVFKATRPDMLQSKSLIGVKQTDARSMPENLRKKVLEQIDDMLEAAQGDWPKLMSLQGEVDLTWIKTFDNYYDRERIAEVIARSNPATFSNEYLVTCCEFGSVLGHVMIQLLPRLYWYSDWPYWESSLLDPHTGRLIPVFHWAIKKMSDYGVDDGFDAKVRACIGILTLGSGVKSGRVPI